MFTTDPSKVIIGYLIRHGELKNMGVWDGWGIFDLSAEGQEQAAKAAQFLAYTTIGRCISSDVPRTMETAQYLLDTGVVLCPYLATDPNLRPWNVGSFTGKEKTAARLNEFKQYIDDPTLVIPEGESRDQLKLRVQVIYQYLAAPYKGFPTAFFIHNSVMKMIMGVDDVKDAVSPGGIISVSMDERGEMSFQIVLGEMDSTTGVS
jgi:broad specificity phosphatase PhoE